MKTNPLRELEALGQSVWLDYLSRSAIQSGRLKRWIEEDGASGLTSNPSIFEKAIGQSEDYDEAIQTLARQGKSVEETYQTLTVGDIQMAADLFRPTYDRTQGADGFVSLEVSPLLARDTEGTVTEARALWAAIRRPNAFIKVPATREGLPAIQQLISEGVNVNITLLFGLPRYREVAEAYLAGLEARMARGQSLSGVASVASFFLSRIDVLLDPRLEEIMKAGGPRAELAKQVHGQAAIASAKIARQIYEEIFGRDRFRRLRERGARVQKLLWASTSTKNPAYPDLKYVEPLIGPETINTMPLETMDACRDHGRVGLTLGQGVAEARAALERLAELGINLDAATGQLEEEGVQKFIRSFELLAQTLGRRREAALARAESRG